MQYAFGDSEIAARRLELLAGVFAASSRDFISQAVDDHPRLVVDLGCGPGYSTQLLADILSCDQAIGLDSSEQFLALAQKTRTEKLSFHAHDVTTVPFPVGPADLLYSRFLLTHLREPATVIRKWATQLRLGGLLLMEETAWIRTRNATFAPYLDMVEALLEDQGNDLYMGRELESLADLTGLRRRSSQLRPLTVSNRDAAALFFLNMQSWKRRPFIQASFPAPMIEQVEAELAALAQGADTGSEIEFGLRQVICERAG